MTATRQDVYADFEFTDVYTHTEYRIEQSHDDGVTWIHPHFTGSIGRDHTTVKDRLIDAIATAGTGIKHRLMHRSVSVLATAWIER